MTSENDLRAPSTISAGAPTLSNVITKLCRHIRRVRVALMIGTIVTAAACGEGSAGTGDVGVVPGGSTTAPTPTPSPSPTATATPLALPPAPFGITADERFALFGWTYRDQARSPIPLTPNDASLGWSARLGTYEVRLAEIGAGTLRYAYPGQNPFAFEMDNGGNAAPVSITLQPGNFFDPAFKATGLLYWKQANGVLGGTAAFGIPTMPSDAPASGKTRFLSTGRASGGADLTFDHAAGSLSGSIGVAWVDDWGPYAPVSYELVATSYDRADMTFSARFVVPGAPSEGMLQGRFFGRDATELALWWQAPILDPYSGKWTVISDVWAAKSY